jgi:hypothetical protein
MPGNAVVRHVVTFGRVLREAGLEVGPGRIQDALLGLDAVDLTRQDDVYWTLRTTIVSRREELEAFDSAFHAWFLGIGRKPQLRRVAPPPKKGEVVRARVPAGAQNLTPQEGEMETGGWSAEELLREKDFGAMTRDEFERTRRLITAIASQRPLRRSRRLRRDSHGRALDVRGLVRSSLSTGGEPIERAFRSRVESPRKLVLILDVSGSMESYSRALLIYLHAARGSGKGVETFAFGTRLTRLTPELASRDPETAFQRASKRVADWSGGTRIGESLKTYNDEWGRRALTRGAVVVILSDGCERGDPELIEREMARLARQAYAVVWVNPLKGHADYEPLAGGMRAALPYVDRFLPGHNVASLDGLAAVLGGIERRHAA